METDSLIRYACVTQPGMSQGDTAFKYLKAIEGTGLGVRVMPIGMMHFGVAPWNEVSHLFITALKTRFINVVCVEPGLSMGAPISVAQFGAAARGGPAEAYEPPTAISGLFTVGIPNVLIISGETMPEGKELDTMKHYNAVVCASEEGSLALAKLGITTYGIEPESGALSKLFSGMNPV